jgi:hypothetical protein
MPWLHVDLGGAWAGRDGFSVTLGACSAYTAVFEAIGHGYTT